MSAEEWLMGVIDRLPEGRWLDDTAVEDALLVAELNAPWKQEHDRIWAEHWRPRLIAFGVSARRLTFSEDYSKVWRVA